MPKTYHDRGWFQYLSIASMKFHGDDLGIIGFIIGFIMKFNGNSMKLNGFIIGFPTLIHPPGQIRAHSEPKVLKVPYQIASAPETSHPESDGKRGPVYGSFGFINTSN